MNDTHVHSTPNTSVHAQLDALRKVSLELKAAEFVSDHFHSQSQRAMEVLESMQALLADCARGIAGYHRGDSAIKTQTLCVDDATLQCGANLLRQFASFSETFERRSSHQLDRVSKLNQAVRKTIFETSWRASVAGHCGLDDGAVIDSESMPPLFQALRNTLRVQRHNRNEILREHLDRIKALSNDDNEEGNNNDATSFLDVRKEAFEGEVDQLIHLLHMRVSAMQHQADSFLAAHACQMTSCLNPTQ